MKKNLQFSIAAIAFAAVFSYGCNSNTTEKEISSTKQIVAADSTTTPATTNPNFSIAPIEYAELSEKALNLLAKFEFDAWAGMMADNVVFAFPDGDVDTRTILDGKAAVIGWWKSWKEKSGIESMTMTEFNHIPLHLTGQIKGGAPAGFYDITYFSNKMVFGGRPVDLRMNFSVHFNLDKKIDRYTTYYDRSVIMKATGRNMLEELKVKK
jgi:ketosteroid isomerase-like protein